MRIAFTGLEFIRREVQHYAWHRKAGVDVQEVAEGALAAELLTTPGGPFVIAGDEPLKAKLALTDDQIIALAMHDIASIQVLAKTRPTQALADALAAPLDTLKAWVQQARTLTTAPPQEA